MKLLLVTDAWEPQINGVTRTWQQVVGQLRQQGHEVVVIHPGLFRSIAAPRYGEIRVALFPGRKVKRLMRMHNADAVHISTEGTLGLAARRWCHRNKVSYTTSYHTQYPLYLKRYYGIPTRITERFIHWFHKRARYCLVPTKSVHLQLRGYGLANTVVWSRGIDPEIFHDRYDYVPETLRDLPRPIFLYTGRVAIEKNLGAFLSLDLPGCKVVVGDGPAINEMARDYPNTHFLGYRFGKELGAHYSAADVFVFPSLTDTFGVVMIEANACGLPVAAFPVTGPCDVIEEGKNGCLDKDLKAACLRALSLDRHRCAEMGKANTWEACANVVYDHAVDRHEVVMEDLDPVPKPAKSSRPGSALPSSVEENGGERGIRTPGTSRYT